MHTSPSFTEDYAFYLQSFTQDYAFYLRSAILIPWRPMGAGKVPQIGRHGRQGTVAVRRRQINTSLVLLPVSTQPTVCANYRLGVNIMFLGLVNTVLFVCQNLWES